MDADTQAKLKTLREYYYDDDYSLKWVAETEKKIRSLVVQQELMKNSSVVAIVEDARSRVNTINKLLTYDETLSQEDRNKLFRERNVHQFYLDRFEGRDIDKRFESINTVLDEELAKIQ